MSTERDWGGGEVQLARLGMLSAEHGDDVLFLASAAGKLRDAVSTGDLPCAVQTFPGRGRSPWAWLRIRAALRAFRPQIVYLNDPRAVSAGGVASIGLGIRRIAARRAAFPIRSPGKYRRFADRIICVSKRVAAICRDSGLPAERLRVVYDGVDVERYAEIDRTEARAAVRALIGEHHGRHDGAPVLLTAGKLTACKGHHVLLDALSRLADRRWVLILLGEGERREALADQAAALGIADRVLMPGFRDDLPRLLCGADVFVFPSLEEGLGSTVIEAMAAGVPIVATTAGGLPELLQPDDGPPIGLSVPPGDAATLAAAMAAMLDDPGAHADTRRARELAGQRFSFDRMVRDTRAVMEELVA
ncbi:glycosyltransferase [Thermostilla marina]